MTDAYFATANPDDPLATAAAALRKTEYEMWSALIPSYDTDFDIYAQEISNSTGVKPARIQRIFMALDRLNSMPHLKQAHLEHGYIDIDRLLAIDASLAKLSDALTDAHQRIDEALAKYLTPTRPNQALPSQANLKRKLRELILAEDDSIAVRDPRPRDSYHFEPEHGAITLTTNPETLATIDAKVRALAAERDVPLAEAMVLLLTGSTPPSVTLNVYHASDVPDAPAFVQGYGWMAADDIVKQATKIVDMEADRLSAFPGYVTPPSMRSVVEGFDGCCRWPGCNRPAWASQMDHRINYADGGPTSPSNLVALCQHHHNIKTDARAFYILDPITRDVVWLFENGTWTVTEPAGPLAPKNRRWVQTFSQAISNYRTRAHEEARALKEELIGN